MSACKTTEAAFHFICFYRKSKKCLIFIYFGQKHNDVICKCGMFFRYNFNLCYGTSIVCSKKYFLNLVHISCKNLICSFGQICIVVHGHLKNNLRVIDQDAKLAFFQIFCANVSKNFRVY